MSRALFACVVISCGRSHAPPAATRLGPAIVAAVVAADHVRAPWRCAMLDGASLEAATLDAGSHHWKLTEHTVTRSDGGPTTIAVIADAGGSAPRTIAALTRLRQRFATEGVDLVISLGGMGTTQAELEGTLGTLADHAPWLLVALPGDLEGEPAQIAAISALRKRGDAVIDGRLARWIDVPGATIGTIPGAGASARLVADNDGCSWRVEDVAAIYGDLTKRPGVRIAAMSEAPRELVHGDPTGELALGPSSVQPVDVVLHGPTSGPSAVRAGVRDGAGALLSPGTSDAMTRLPEPTAPTAGVLLIRGVSWSWRPIVDGS